jgi:hypothetical protein
VERSWRLWREQRPGTMPLFECRVGAHSTLSPNPGCERQFPLGPVGYVHSRPVAAPCGSTAAQVPGNGDHFVSTDAACEGHRTERALGYAIA